jgi:hypothetical protein
MYNRYIGNTGKFYRVEEPEDKIPPKPVPVPDPDSRSAAKASNPIPKPKGLFSGSRSLSDGLKGLLKGILPDKVDIGDLLLILILLLLYIEKKDEDILIILGALVLMGFDK